MTDLVWTPIKIKIGQVVPWSDNPRMSTKSQAQRLIKSEKELGQIQTLAVSPFTDDGRVLLYDGHQRCAAWLTVKDPSYEVQALQSNRMLTDDERRKVSVLLHTATGSWNWESLSSWSAADLREWGMDGETLKGWNNDANNLKEMLNAGQDEPVDAEPQIDRAAELQVKWHTATGQLWKLGENRLLIGDCTVRENVERLMGGEYCNLMVTDPPYGVNYDPSWRLEHQSENDSQSRWNKKNTKINTGQVENDNRADWREAWLLFSGNVAYVWHGGKHSNKVQESLEVCDFEIRSQIIWAKQAFVFSRGDYHWKHEPCWYAVRKGKTSDWIGDRKQSTVWEFRNNAAIGDVTKNEESTGHGTQKPVEAMFRPIQNHAGNVYEPFAGSGTTIIAAHNLNRRCFAMEISENYGAVILERFFTATGITPELIN